MSFVSSNLTRVWNDAPMFPERLLRRPTRLGPKDIWSFHTHEALARCWEEGKKGGRMVGYKQQRLSCWAPDVTLARGKFLLCVPDSYISRGR